MLQALFSQALRFAPRTTKVLMYHNVIPSGEGGIDVVGFERHLRFLQQYFSVIPLLEYDRPRSFNTPPRVAVTFDDGMRNQADFAVPLLRRYQIPTTFFISTRHCRPGCYLWFNYLKGLASHYPGDQLELRGTTYDMRPQARAASVARLTMQLLALKPHPSAIYAAIERELPALEAFVPAPEVRAKFQGMSTEQIADIARDPLFTVGAHTVDHPLLPLCDLPESRYQISENKQLLERITGLPCKVMAYPVGAYDREDQRLCRNLKFLRAFAVDRQLAADAEMAVARVGIYSRSLPILAMKATLGASGLLRKCAASGALLTKHVRSQNYAEQVSMAAMKARRITRTASASVNAARLRTWRTSEVLEFDEQRASWDKTKA